MVHSTTALPSAYNGRALLRDAVAGLVTAVVLIANIVSFAALMFQGVMAVAVPTAIWAMLVGSGVSGLWIAWKSSLPPMATGIDSPTGAVLVLLAAGAHAAVLAAGGSKPSAVQAALLMLSAATLLTGLLLLALGSARRGAMLRFVPYFVVAGFMGATGWLLIAGGVRMSTGHGLSIEPGVWSMQGTARLASAVGVFVVMLALRRWVQSAMAMPVGLMVMTVAGAVGLHTLGMADPAQGWYLPSLGSLTAWSPLSALSPSPLSLKTALGFLPDLLAVAFVALVSMVTKVSSLEISRKAFGDLDQELRAHGLATLVVAPLGGFLGSMQLGSSRLLESTGGASRLSGVASSLVLLCVGLAHFDLPALIPLPIAAGLVFFLGYGFLMDALARPLRQRDGLNLLLAVVIMVLCVRYSYMVGVLSGIVAACLLFAASYARAGVVRQHLTRAAFTGNVTRSAPALRYLGEHGQAIQLYWLSGYLFFGSSEGVFERVRRDLLAHAAHQFRFVILDFGTVTGADASATQSLTKLRHFCEQHGARLMFSSVSPTIAQALMRDGLVPSPQQQPPFADVNAALGWCEDQVLEGISGGGAGAVAEFETWLQTQLGPELPVQAFLGYLEQHQLAADTVLYRQGDAADTIDLVAAGRLVVDMIADTGNPLRARRITTHSVVGEMGFFRRTVRAATVSADGPATVYTLQRAAFDRMRQEQPELAGAFYEFLLRSLSDRLILTDRVVAALTLSEGPARQPVNKTR